MTGLDTSNLDINQRINLRGLVQAWLAISEERFQEDLDKKLYNKPRSRKRKKLYRTGNLRNNWRKSINGSGDDVRSAQLSFLLYGRFVDMGVGPGLNYALAKYQGVRKNGEKPSRRPVRWYSKRKGYETHRLRELLVKYHIDIPLEMLENALTTKVELTA
ncbi:hypothetical protein G8759_20115 [Spirosoma aureum]|uniref:Uncharacterized protein n=1 Tax=Spirosoma aureum TaxID=2692134 RepID=A0A6G9AQV7_9BACT|nr:hypothetical protein [Spirosoma aureum]QIP14758.1 hypothetical protein G8759_20115 [Spirosoma aureum]